MVRRFSLSDARTRLSELLERAQAGEGIVITKRGRDHARLVPVATQEPRRPGILRGTLQGDVLSGLDQAERRRWS